MKQFLHHLLGTEDYPLLAACLVFALVGSAARLFVGAMKRNPKKDGSPLQFSWKHLFRDNIVRNQCSVGLNTIMILVFVRFAPQLLGQGLSEIAALGLGYQVDKLSHLADKFFGRGTEN